MSDNSKEKDDQLSERELLIVQELQAEAKRKLQILLSDPKTSYAFKRAFINEDKETEKW